MERPLPLAILLCVLTKGVASDHVAETKSQSRTSVLGPSCNSILLPESRAAFSDATGAFPISGLLEAGGELITLSAEHPKNFNLSMALQQAQEEVLNLRKSWFSEHALDPPPHRRLLRSNAPTSVKRHYLGSPAFLHYGVTRPTVKFAASRRAGELVQVPGNNQHLGVETEAAYDRTELRARLVEACQEVTRLEQALNTSKSQVDSLRRSHSTAHIDSQNVSDMPNYELARERSTSVPLPSSLPLDSESSFDIVVNAFKRDVHLELSLRRYVSCSQGISPVAKIHVVWNDVPRSIPPNLLQLATQGKLEFFVPPTQNKGTPGRISSRFWPFNFSSAAVFHVDDDVVHTCEILNDMFQIWRTDVDGIVGTSPRWLDLSANWDWDSPTQALSTGEYNIVYVTKGAFVHKRFFDEYWQPLWDRARNFVDSNNCGEDILFSAIHMTLVGPHHVYAIAGSVNHGDHLLMEGLSLQKFLNLGEGSHGTYPGLTGRTGNYRSFVGETIAAFLRSQFPSQVKAGVYSTPTKKFWRSNTHPELSCRQLPLPCFNRDWPECWKECGDDPVRGSSVCLRGDGACYAGSGINYGSDFNTNTMVMCVGGKCTQ